ncbi:hypothetical protein JRO89_XS06G0188000 [Xanthoceras sorbifolium]|uniref:Polyprotein n=1 Tax=Xanthoceras sorbifolium TaxID=99658 RepID=A0ABQ8HZ15_9ROSI|nr:hypothetical protein JRO89_XS06G0188000 [Xanthoceras sorbifolium]
MSEATYIGVKITRDHSKKLLALSQEPYITKILELFNMANCRPMDALISKCYQCGDLCLVGYIDAYLGSDLDEQKLTFEYEVLLSSKKHTCIALCIVEDKLMACSTAVQERVCLKRFIEDLEIVIGALKPVTIHCDNQAVIPFTKDLKYHSKSKHIETKYKFVRDVIGKREVIIQYISLREMVVDPFTKAVTRDANSSHARSLGLRRM